MNMIKKIVAMLTALVLILGLVGCAQDDSLANFKPVGVRVVESIGGIVTENTIDDKEFAEELWDMYLDLDIIEDTTAEMGDAYFYMCLYDEDKSTLAVFAIYENGSCCFEDDNFKTLYTVQNGEEAYNDFVECCLNYSSADSQNS